MSLLLVPPPLFSPKPLLYLKPKSNPNPNPKLKLQCCTSTTPSTNPNNNNYNLSESPSSFLSSLKPYLLSRWPHILSGWSFSAASALSLSLLVPKLGHFSATISGSGPLDLLRLRNDAAVLAALAAARIAAGYWQQAMLWEAALGAVHEVRVYVFGRVLERDLGFWEGRGGGVGAGDVAYRITTEASDVADTVYALLNTIVPSILQLSAMATQMLAISPILSYVSVLMIPLMAYVNMCLGQELRKISKDANIRIAALSAYLNEVLPSILFVKANNAELSESARFQWLAQADRCERLKKKKMKALVPQIVQIIYCGALLTFCVGSMVAFGGTFDYSGMVSFITSLVFLIEPIQGIGKAYNELKEGEPAVERLFGLTRFQTKVIENSDAVSLEHVNGEVKFCDILFKYDDGMPPVLNGLDLTIKSGETVALVGPSGGGKTTLVKLLLRLYDPVQGRILIDNHDIKTLRLKSLRRHVGLVSQDITLFSGTVAENIGYRDLTTEIDMEMVKIASRTANADEFIESLPEKYETNIGPRGSSLSGGQKQRLAIARAVYQNASILILDEATSALDSRSELLVRQAVQRLMENRTVLVIAHRLETVLMANRIFLLEDGNLRELNRSLLLGGRGESLLSSGLII